MCTCSAKPPVPILTCFEICTDSSTAWVSTTPPPYATEADIVNATSRKTALSAVTSTVVAAADGVSGFSVAAGTFTGIQDILVLQGNPANTSIFTKQNLVLHSKVLKADIPVLVEMKKAVTVRLQVVRDQRPRRRSRRLLGAVFKETTKKASRSLFQQQVVALQV